VNGNKNSGRAAKKLATISAVIIVISGLGLSISLFSTAVAFGSGLVILLALVYLAAFLFLAYMCYTMLTAIGDAAENSANNNQILREIMSRLATLERHPGEIPAPDVSAGGGEAADAPGYGARSRRVCARCGAVLDEDAAFCGVCGTEIVVVYEVKVTGEGITCPGCGRKQQSNRKSCSRCGAAFVYL
jgi:DNA-directed RNA polymerase subunit RPC12/RpoP